MPLSCECHEWEGEGWGYEFPCDYSAAPTEGRRKRCCSCGELIEHAATTAEFTRFRGADDDIELRVWGDDGHIPMASWHMCETCADLYFSITELGFCITLGADSMRECAQEVEEYRLNEQKLRARRSADLKRAQKRREAKEAARA